MVSCQAYNPVEIHPERIIKANKKRVRHITNPEKITQGNKESVCDLDCDEIEFPVREKNFSKIEKKIIFALTCFVVKID